MKLNYLIFFIFLVCGCERKAEPLEEFGTPYFYINGDIENQKFDIKAGENSYYLSTNYYTDSLNVTCFEGKFAQTCEGCKSGLKLIIRNYKANNLTPFHQDSGVFKGSYTYYNLEHPLISAYNFKFIGKPHDSININKNGWYKNNILESTYKSWEVALKPGTIYPITYSSIDKNSCQSEISVPFNLSNIYEKVTLPNFVCEPIDKSNAIFGFRATGHSTNDFLWDFGNGAKAKGSQVFYGYPNGGNYLVKLTQIVNGDSNCFYKWINVKNYPKCYSNLEYSYSILYDNLNLSTVSIEFTDEQGVIYSSSNITQNKTSNFWIDQTYNYLINNKGQRTRMVSFQLNCLLSSGTNTIRLKNIKGIMAVAIPE